MRIVKGDKVIIISGNNRGKTGEVLKVIPGKNRVLVKGLNMVKRHTRPTQKNPQGGILEKEAPIHLSNVMLYDSKAGRGTRIRSRKLEDEKSSKVRISVQSGEVIEIKTGA
ncbi:MAG: 50S ribosomal protein L24 [Candidatus Glassbacteria bacterium RIFCSPLOWO2_12_FULL_58_11]|uniref:Large ribosomal subunit protein uL24 n=2 Tax=Candidatus Glassiibacteriota TaxID=1817805 RepID=A0A1F5YPT6_9BACT|nr:ribosomal protein L24 [uncultured bacterium]OGF99740.1 MAG: 50S ribosomal protein L24 [Candidatus Glassbacteria bacterium GWA2_58_10]OGG01997.1 MAG: 50S ribosomal protein L24 [Candidatus Glassbacteria bacterium RIFCSPLOWO2_12_FULL_58_11]